MTTKKDRTDPTRNLWECPVCSGINAWSWQDAERAAELFSAMTKKPWTTPDFANARLPQSVACAHGSAFDNICGHCGADIVHIDSPILAECYTHAA